MLKTRASCIGCMYRSSLNMVGTYCAYILVTGHSRGCPASKCDKYLPRSKDNTESFLRIAYTYQDGRSMESRDEALREFYEEGLSDLQISDRLGLSEQTVRRRRIRKNLPAQEGRY